MDAKIINGVLHTRQSYKQEYTEAKQMPGGYADAIKELAALTDEQRLEVFSYFCTSCGIIQNEKRCSCWNDS